MWLTLSLLLLPSASCIISLSGLQGQIISRNYPQGYPDDIQQSWEIQVATGYGIRLSFTHIDIEPSPDCAYDHVQVFCDEALHPPICGSKDRVEMEFQFPFEYYTTGNWMRVMFLSDFSNEERYTGFAAYYTAVDINECEEEDRCSHYCNNYIGGYLCSCKPGYFLQENKRICGVNCTGEVSTSFKGMITSPNYPEPYAENSQCQYRIEIEQGFEVILGFAKDFEVEGDPSVGCISDVLKVTSGGREYGPFCGDQAPVIKGHLSNVVEITFNTDDHGERKGWKIIYKSTAKQCSPDILEYSIIQPKKVEYDYKDSVRLHCESGFELYDTQESQYIDDAVVHCQKDGTWNSIPYICKPVDCGRPAELKNGYRNFTSTIYKSQNKYSCEEPYYKLEGNAIFNCSHNAEWVDTASGQETLPKCKPVCGNCLLSSNTGRIFGGKRAKLGEFPWQVRLLTTSGQMGGGALISDSWVLTAAHLFDKTHQLEIHGGFINLRDRSSKNMFAVEQVFIHPKFNKHVKHGQPNFNHDIALIKLQEEVKLGPNLSPLCLPERGDVSLPNFGTLGYISGWGRTENRSLAIILQFAEVPVVSMDECENSNFEGKKPIFTPNMMCAGRQGVDSCQGDSGGPYVFQDRLDRSRHIVRGIVSFGPQQCGHYGVYTHVGNYLDWIEKTMKEHENGEGEEVLA
ncbi:complement C1s subcomponent-like [Scyliorhinus torazame]|uniref:complement C1s subcomponent-like n=1 Tax=Scyliorhinus torazame TaxID=75743 RepID=UPI003B58B751